MGGACRHVPGTATGVAPEFSQAVTKGGAVVPSVAQGSLASEQDREKGVILRLDHLQSDGGDPLNRRNITADFALAVATHLRLDERIEDLGRRIQAAESSARSATEGLVSMEARMQEVVTQHAKSMEKDMRNVVTQSARVADEVASKDARDSKRWEELQATLQVLMTGLKKDVSVREGDVILTTGAEYAQTRSQTRGGHAECSSVRSSQ